MQRKKLLLVLISLLVIGTFALGQTAPKAVAPTTITVSQKDYEDLLAKYESLMKEYEQQLTDYGKLLDDYGDLTTKYKDLKDQFVALNSQLDALNTKYKEEIGYYEQTKLALETANKVINDLSKSVKDLMAMTDTRYFTIYPQIGYIGTTVTPGIAFSMYYPKFPLSAMVDVDLIWGQPIPINIQIGLGIRF